MPAQKFCSFLFLCGADQGIVEVRKFVCVCNSWLQLLTDRMPDLLGHSSHVAVHGLFLWSQLRAA